MQKQREDWVLERLLRLLPGSRPGGGEGDTGSRTADPACQWDGMEGPESEHFSRQKQREDWVLERLLRLLRLLPGSRPGRGRG